MLSPAAIHEATRYRACWEVDEVEQVIEAVTRLGTRVSKHLLRQRGHERNPYTAPVLISQRQKVRSRTAPIVLPVVARDLSRSGIGLIAPLFFEPEQAGSDSLVRSSNVFRDGSMLDLGLLMHTGDLLWVYGIVGRVCTVQHDFLDVGVRFLGRITAAIELNSLA